MLTNKIKTPNAASISKVQIEKRPRVLDNKLLFRDTILPQYLPST